MPHLRSIAIALMTLLVIPAVVQGQQAPSKSSPFQQVRWVGDSPEVFIESNWYTPVTIDGVQVEAILSFCQQRWPGRMKKRFGEDLPEALELMGHPLPARVDLELLLLPDGDPVTLKGVEMSRSNRRAILHANRNAAGNGRGGDRASSQAPTYITREQAIKDIAEFERRLDDQFAYRHLRDIDLAAELDEARASLDEKIQVTDFVMMLNRVMARFGDGHAVVSSRQARRPSIYPPFLVEDAGDGFIALRPDRQGFLDQNRPYIVSIDDIPIEKWLQAVRPDVTDGSPQLVRVRSMRALRDLQLIREHLRLPPSDDIRCRLAASPTDPDPVEHRVTMTSRRPTYGPWPRNQTGILPGNIGYLRIESMDPRLLQQIHASMKQFQDTRGLVIDVRGNGGGSRAPLLALAGYLKDPVAEPWVGNVACYRLSERFDPDHLEARFMYRADDPAWTERQRAAIDSFAPGFTPEWQPGDGFSDWHYLVLDNTGHESEYHYDKPVVILVDPVCFSATDIFLGALSGRPGITTMGRASGGGSARSQGFPLSASGLEVRCASMASFRPDGRLYDGRGVQVDVQMDPSPRYFLQGGQDALLDAAVTRIMRSEDSRADE